MENLELGDLVKIIANEGPAEFNPLIGEHGIIVLIGELPNAKGEYEPMYILDRWPPVFMFPNVLAENNILFSRRELKKIDPDISELLEILERENFPELFSV